MPAGVSVIPAGTAAIVPRIIGMIVASMEDGGNRMGVCVIAIGMAPNVIVIPVAAIRVVPQNFEPTAVITAHGVTERVIVIRVMGVLIARLKILAHLVFGFLIPASPMADSVIVMMVTPVRIVRLLIKKTKPVFEERRPLGRLSDV